MKKYRLKRWVKVTLLILFIGFTALTIYQIKTEKTTYSTPLGSYECKGKIIKICYGSKQVADYLGV